MRPSLTPVIFLAGIGLIVLLGKADEFSPHERAMPFPAEMWREHAEEVVVGRCTLDFDREPILSQITDEERDHWIKLGRTEEALFGFRLWEIFHDQLWDAFANQPEEVHFNNVTTENWFEKWTVYRDALTAKAQKEGFDAASLERVLNHLTPSPDAKRALLPVGAYLAREKDHPVWIIVCKWEYAKPGEREPEKLTYLAMMHIRGWAIRASDLEQVGFFTCL